MVVGPVAGSTVPAAHSMDYYGAAVGRLPLVVVAPRRLLVAVHNTHSAVGGKLVVGHMPLPAPVAPVELVVPQVDSKVVPQRPPANCY